MRLKKRYLCETCGETRLKMFRGRMRSSCYECHKKRKVASYAEDKSALPHLCRKCGTPDSRLFYPNSRTLCKACLDEKRKRGAKLT